ncbi:MAG: DUF4426 domain-containing protein [Pseudomonadota bacterium]
MKHLFSLATLICLTALSATAVAEQYVGMDNFEVHYSAISTDKLPPAVARAYGITRSQSRAMVNVTVLRKDGEDSLGTPIGGAMTAAATNLNGQRRDVDMRRIDDSGAIYYVGFVRVTDAETLDFVVDVTPEGGDEPIRVAFRQQFFVD